MLISCWSAKGGSGTTVVAAALGLVLARRSPAGALLVDLTADAAPALGLPDPGSPGVLDWLAAGDRATADALGRLEIEVGGGLSLLPAGSAAPGVVDPARVPVLAALLGADDRPVVVDGGTAPHGDGSGVGGPIVDGSSHYVGSKKHAVLAAISRSLERQSAAWVPIDIAGNDKEFAITVGEGKGAEATLWIMGIAPECKVKIEKGENAGHDIVYRNVARTLMPAGMWRGKALNVILPREGVLGDQGRGVVALLQQGSHGRVLGAATWGAIAA